MPQLSSAFPDGYRAALVTREFVPGVILYLYCDFLMPPKDKFVLVLTPEDPTPLFVIGSGYGPCARNAPSLQACHVLLGKADYKYLRVDSWLDCTIPETWFTRTEIIDQLMKDTGRIKGRLLPKTRSSVLKAVNDAGKITLEPRQVRSICSFI